MNDKVKHIIAGILISITLSYFGIGFGLLASFIIGALKEIIWDWLMKKGTPEFLDFAATGAGGFVGIIPWVVFGG